MPPVHLLDRWIEYESASKHESDVLRQSSYRPEAMKAYMHLKDRMQDISSLAAHHLGVDQSLCIVAGPAEWIRGAFNICIPVSVRNHHRYRRLYMRCPMAFKLGPADGSADEKLRCEVGAYAYIEEYCPEIKVPDLLGFGFTDGTTFTHATNRPLHVRLLNRVRRWFCFVLRRPVPSRYVQHFAHSPPLSTGYLLLQRIEPEDGEMLSKSWKEHMNDSTYRANLFRGIARVTLSLARVPQARIGAFTFHDDGTISLTNRPLTCTMAIHEHLGAANIVSPSTTYSSIDPYISDLLTFQDQRFLAQPNAVFDQLDGEAQTSEHTLMRAISHLCVRPKLRNGPFLPAFTDLHQSNIFVDKSWNVTCLIDLEWMCSQPVDMLGPPHWLTGLGVDQIKNEKLQSFNLVREEFMSIFAEEERLLYGNKVYLAEAFEASWQSGAFWYCLALHSINGMYTMFPNILQMFGMRTVSKDVQTALSTFWQRDAGTILHRKLAEKREYDQCLRRLFGATSTG